MDLMSAKTVLKTYMNQRIPTFMWGTVGIGKSDLVREVVSENKVNLIDVRALLLDPVDLRGLPVPSEDSKSGRKMAAWLPPEFLPDEKRDGKRGILFLDELNAAPPSVMAACFQLVLDRKVGEYKLPDGWDIIAAGNRQSDRAAANRMPTALANRFGHIDVDVDVDVWRMWANSNDIDPRVSAFIKFRPELLHKMDESDMRAFPTPRSWAQVSKVCNIERNLLFPTIMGLVGEGTAHEFEGFIRTCEDLPDIEEIIKKPNKAEVPTDDNPSAKYAIATALAKASTEDNFDKILTYGQRLEKEFEILLCMDATRRDESLCDTDAFVEFTQRNKDIQL